MRTDQSMQKARNSDYIFIDFKITVRNEVTEKHKTLITVSYKL